jgi:hypothetical protein
MSADHDSPIPPRGPAGPQTCEHPGPCPQEACVTVSANFAQARVWARPAGKAGRPKR